MRHESGFSLIEVLIALAIFAVGLLGVASLQIVGLKSCYDAYLASQAVVLAQGMGDQLRVAHRTDESLLTQYLYNGDGPGGDCEAPPNGAVALGSEDRDYWLNTVACALPAGVGHVQQTGEGYRITVLWRASMAQGAADEPHSEQLSLEVVL
ncbi:type IV pilus modification protein PilV [Thioalkalivibrio thiocyanodenitrificans]|uniref:type IV pilus modification protein PilV n=1 Tax=Thioalkalivibrio thiocyanodenitrificans TaxID=243063 RepID=UPI000379DF06|nr:type IV pilus modification protein PilV [Thioalkalivibrio thiocyanodenitrificans]